MDQLVSLYKFIVKFVKKNPLEVLVIISVVYPFLLSLNNILNGSIPFWFDPARDFLLAQNNLRSPTLIGPPSGIPGIFYGPYWIWLISITLIFSKDPRLAAIVILLIPYFTIFPFILFNFSKVFGTKICLLLWLFFIFSSQTYATFLWNPHPAPLIFLVLAYLLVLSITYTTKLSTYVKLFFAGIVSGLLLNFHISFGLGIFLGSTIFILAELILNKEKNSNVFRFFLHLFVSLVSFLSGFFITLVPYIAFELRHNFLQTRTLVKALSDAIIYNSATVGQTGLKPAEIIRQLFFGKAATMFTFSNEQVMAIYVVIAAVIIYGFLKKRIKVSKPEKMLSLFLTICVLTLLLVFITSKNPVWDYHFIGVEIIVMLTIGLIAKKFGFLESHFSFWMLVFSVGGLISFSYSLRANPYAISSLFSKKYIVRLIYENADKKPFAVAAYSPAIYTYDFDYLFGWLGSDIYHQLPETDLGQAALVYLIVPKTSETTQTEFVNAKTPSEKYTTEKYWLLDDGTTVFKRVQLTN